MGNDYKLLLNQIKELADTKYLESALSNICSFIYNSISHLNWVGLYANKDNNLYLYLFSGKVACAYIPYGKGVCGTALKEKQFLVVDDVHKFKGHIACDSISKSEFVLPVYKDKEIVFILDIDSDIYSRFDSDLIAFFNEVTKIIESALTKEQIKL